MLLRIPKLQWLTVQQSGMCARVVVRERPDKAPVLDRKVPTDVIASRAGVLTRVEAVAGNCLCAPGQAAKLKNGAQVRDWQFRSGTYRVYAEDGEFLLLGRVENGLLTTIKSFFEVNTLAT